MGRPGAAAAGGKTIEEIYQKKTPLEHVLLRPDTYVGSIEKHTQTLWVYEGGQLVNRAVTYVPGLYKIFDEILVNAADNKQRDPIMDAVKVTISVEQNTISVYNNGDGVPVEVHNEQGVYVPEMIFGHLLTSSNYDDNEKKTTGGRNGYGAKLANIFSTEFVIETADGKRGKKYKQVFSNNMSAKSEPAISSCKSNENWTKVTFKPDLAKFHMTYLEEDVVALMSKRVLDIAGCLGRTVKVELNGQKLPVKTFSDYVGLYLASAQKGKEETLPRIYERANDRWEVCVSLSDGQFQQVSFVNSIATIRGGTHVQHVSEQIVSHIQEIVNKKNKNANVKGFQIRNHLWVFVNSLIDNPAFDSQTKETLTTRQTSFGSKCELSPEFLKKVSKCGVVDNVLSWADFKQSKELKKNDGAKRQRLTGIAKLDDANDAGGKNSEACTLILTEGDSAKALAMSGISVVGRNHYGVFPLRGKLLNVREATHKQIMDNAEITSIKQILGLQQGKGYENTKSLRYGHLMIMTDQDHDGSHIKGLIINFIHTFWPSLLKVPGFLVEFITPIVKATHKNGKVLSFYTMPEYESWKESLRGETKGWSIKYYKGLGTSTAKEGKEYFRDLVKHKKDFAWDNDEDGDSIELAFSKKKTEARKIWLRGYQPGTFLDQTQRVITYSDFINKELILFSLADLARSVPSMVDGLKPGQRKILFAAFKRNFTSQAKVAQFSGYVSEHSAYHHGEQSLASTIIGMAQNFVGSNNINILAPIGQFGTRSQGGKDHASARYIYTSLTPLTRTIFPKPDDILLNFLREDGQSIEPFWYAPILPMVLVNGSEGIGTGWSTFVPNYNPRDIVTNLKHLLRDEQLEPMDPWYKGFKGTIVKSATKESGVSYTVTGIVEQVNETTIRVLELPIRKWTQDYKEFLEALLCGTEKIKEPSIKDYREHNTDTRVHFEISLSEEKMAEALAEGLTKKFKLSTTISTSNMNLFDKDGHIRKYDTPEQILEDFYHIRLELYVKRKEVQVENLQYELLKLDNKVRFILGVVKGEIVVNNRKRAELLVELKTKGFTPFPKKAKASDLPVVGGDGSDVEADDEEKLNKGVRAGDYEYLLSMPIGTLTLEKVQQLCNERDKLEGDVEELKKCTPKDLWEKDLDNFLEQLTAQELEEEKEDELELKQMAKEGAAIFKRAAAGRKPAAKAKTADKENAVKPTKKATASTKASNASKKAAKPVELDSEEEYFNTSLQDRLAAYAKGKGPLTEDNSMEDAVKEVSPPTKHNAPKAAPVAKKRANTKASKASKATEDVAAHDSPDAKVRKVRASPFNKKSGSVIPQLAKLSIEAEADSDVEAAPQARPKRRAARPAVHYIESDTEEDKAASEDISDFEDEGSE